MRDSEPADTAGCEPLIRPDRSVAGMRPGRGVGPSKERQEHPFNGSSAVDLRDTPKKERKPNGPARCRKRTLDRVNLVSCVKKRTIDAPAEAGITKVVRRKVTEGNDLRNIPCEVRPGTAPAFTGARTEQTKERYTRNCVV